LKNNDNFFVGYLPFPASLKQRYLLLVPTVIIIAIVAAVVLAGKQQTAGAGTWNVANATSITGRLSLAPYPVVYTASGQSVLLVVQGKQDAGPLSAEFEGQMVTVTGFDIRRGGWHMLEIPASGAIVAATGEPIVALPVTEPLGSDTLQGEIVDSKCFLGVMKPGSGKVHRACATLCLLGGMPPMLVVKTENGRYGYLLINEDGSSASRQLAGQVAIPVALTGDLERRGDLIYIRMPGDRRSIEPLMGDALSGYGETLAVENLKPEFCGVMPHNQLTES